MHHVSRIFGQGRFALFFLFGDQNVDVGGKIGEGGNARSFESAGQVEDFVDICNGLFAALSKAEKAPGAGVFKDGMEQFGKGMAIGELPPTSK